MTRSDVFPRPGAFPGSWPTILVVPLVVAWILVLPASADPFRSIPGDGSLLAMAREVNEHWVCATTGLAGLHHSRLALWPYGLSWIDLDGFPIGAVLARPLAVLGAQAAFTSWTVIALWLAGVAVGWSAGRWWRSTAAAAFAAVSFQCAGGVLTCLLEGQADRVLGVGAAVLGLTLLAEVLVTPSGFRSIAAGALLGFATLCKWQLGLAAAAAVVVLLGLAALDRLPLGRALPVFLGFLLVVMGPVCWVLPGFAVDAWGPALFSPDEGAGVLLDSSAQNLVALLQGSGLRPVAWALVLLSLFHGRPRRWLAPVLWAVLGLALAAGRWVWVDWICIPGPWAVLHGLPLFRLVRDPSSAILLSSVSVALLAGGGASFLAARRRWIPIVFAAAGLVEALLFSPLLPIPSIHLPQGVAVEAMAAGHGPMMVLPTAPPPGQDWRGLFAQVVHGRAVVAGPLPLDAAPASPEQLRVLRVPGLPHFVGCEQEPGLTTALSPAGVRAELARMGLTEVWVDPLAGRGGAYAASAAWVACVERLLGSPSELTGGWRRYALEDPSDIAPASAPEEMGDP